MKLWKSFLMASCVSAEIEKTPGKRFDGCRPEQLLKWKDEMQLWRKDQESKFPKFLKELNTYEIFQNGDLNYLSGCKYKDFIMK